MQRLPMLCLALSGAIVATGALAAGTDSAEALTRYRQERAVCTEGKSNQDLQTCLREASAALQASRQPQSAQKPALDPVNKTKRCDALRDAEAQDCMARMNDQGTTSGSVAAGGILREIVTPSAPASAASR